MTTARRSEIDALPSQVVLRTGKSCSLTHGLHTPDGRLVWVDINAEPIFDAAGKEMLGCCLVMRDVTRRRAAEEALKASEEMKSSIMAASVDAILTIDSDRHDRRSEPRRRAPLQDDPRCRRGQPGDLYPVARPPGLGPDPRAPAERSEAFPRQAPDGHRPAQRRQRVPARGDDRLARRKSAISCSSLSYAM